MPKRKYKNIRISRECNVSSTSHYGLKVWWEGGCRIFDPFNEFFFTNVKYNAVDWQRAPKYLVNEAVRLFALAVLNDGMTFYEYDRDGNSRFKDLRYHDPDMVMEWAKKQATAAK